MKKKYYEEYLKIIDPIINNEEYIKRKTYRHHQNKTVYDHCLQVSYLSYKIARPIPYIDEKSVAIGGILHDFYNEPWMHKKERAPFFKKHGFVHAKEALDNSYKYFPELMNKKTANVILRHMFPLNIVPPKYLESWIVTMVDKIVSMEIFFQKETLSQIFKIGRSV